MIREVKRQIIIFENLNKVKNKNPIKFLGISKKANSLLTSTLLTPHPRSGPKDGAMVAHCSHQSITNGTVTSGFD